MGGRLSIINHNDLIIDKNFAFLSFGGRKRPWGACGRRVVSSNCGAKGAVIKRRKK
jgi:hypothetical protein